MKERQKLTYKTIGAKLNLAPNTAKRLYNHFYYEKLMEMFHRIYEATGIYVRQNYRFKVNTNAKSIYDKLVMDYPEHTEAKPGEKLPQSDLDSDGPPTP